MVRFCSFGIVGSGWDSKHTDDKISLKEKIRLLTGGGGGGRTTYEDDKQQQQQQQTFIPTSEEIGKIEDANFIQEKFSSTYIDPSNMPKQKKKKKGKQKQNAGKQTFTETDTATTTTATTGWNKMDPVSHEDAMFSNTLNTLHVSRFSNTSGGGGVGEGKEGKPVHVDEDSIFGAMFFDDPEVRKKRWIAKLTKLRARFAEEGA